MRSRSHFSLSSGVVDSFSGLMIHRCGLETTSGFVSVDDLTDSRKDAIDTFGDKATRWSVTRGMLR